MDARLAEYVDGQNVVKMSNSQGRYDNWYDEDNVQFYLEEVSLAPEEARLIVFKILEQAVKDYVDYYDTTDEQLKEDWLTAQGFIFNPDYVMQWGDIEVSPEQLLDMVDVDIQWVREQTRKKLKREKKHG